MIINSCRKRVLLFTVFRKQNAINLPVSLPHVAIQLLAFIQTIFTSPCNKCIVLLEVYFVKSILIFCLFVLVRLGLKLQLSHCLEAPGVFWPHEKKKH